MTADSLTVVPGSADGTLPFDLLGELPTGRTVLEASAGTGKTYAIAGLVARYVVEAGIPLPELLVVTFTRAATAELRERVRNRLVATAAHLGRVLAGGPREHPDDVTAHLSSPGVPLKDIATRHDRATRALADFDAATIATIHGFCQQVLRTLGLTVDTDRDAELVQDQRDVVNAVVDDLLVQVATRQGVTDISRRDLLAIAEKVVGNPDARIVPDPADVAGTAAVRAELAHRIREVLEERKRTRRMLSYDDLLTQLRDAVADDAQGDAAAAALRARYRVALIDEFQDTDPVQWDILNNAFRGPDATLVLIGDPKQAIYSFRGADVHAYLDAVAAADTKQTLDTNWRSDGPLLDALDALLRGATFGSPDIAYRTVKPAEQHRASRLINTPKKEPLRLRCVLREHQLRESRGDINATSAREHIAADLAVQTVELLSSDARILASSDDSEGRELRAGDVAVLVRTNAEAVQIHRALREAHVPAIINGVGSVFETPAASEWRRLLEALERPSNASRARALALTSFLGWTGERLAAADEEQVAGLHEKLHEWAAILRERGVASLFRTITVSEDLPARLLGTVGGERHLTDLEHIGQLLHRAAVQDELGPSALGSWLVQTIAETDEEKIPPDERARRLESDARAVQILTVHRSKGLQYPVVFAPYLWSPGWLYPPVPAFHDAGGRALDVGGKRPEEDWEENKELAKIDTFGEGLRLLYVALTRAEHHVVVWWSPCKDASLSGLGRVLFARDPSTGALDTRNKGIVSNDERCHERLSMVADWSGGTISIAATDPDPPEVRWEAPTEEVATLAAATLDRTLDRAWHRTSYSRLTSQAHGPLVGSEPTEDTTTDEDLLPAGATDDAPDSPDDAFAEGDISPSPERALRAFALPLSDVPGGADFGTFVHTVLEHVDFIAEDLPAELSRIVAEQTKGRAPAIGDVPTLVIGLAEAIRTPLGPLAGGRRLADLGPRERLNELDFELPLDPRLGGGVTVARIGELLRSHLPADDPLAGYADLLTDPAFRHDLRGYLAGSIDLVLRVAGDDGSDRFVVADHKTNRLGTWGEPITAWDYRPEAMTDAMIRGHYPLQALLYQVALHRYLRWRVRDYDPDAHLGGALYLFLRGMAGADTPVVDDQPCGVFAWQPPATLVVATSQLLDGGAA